MLCSTTAGEHPKHVSTVTVPGNAPRDCACTESVYHTDGWSLIQAHLMRACPLALILGLKPVETMNGDKKKYKADLPWTGSRIRVHPHHRGQRRLRRVPLHDETAPTNASRTVAAARAAMTALSEWSRRVLHREQPPTPAA